MNNWWKKGVIYQIYPKSFQDSKASGQGDIRGIIKRLDYLKTLGIGGIWLTPMYVSPQVDNGYDIADYRDIDPIYGSMSDFEDLIKEAHSRDIKIIMDMVFNHCSTQHFWFKEALKGENNPYHDYFIWQKNPTNWKSKFGGSAWELVPSLGKYYLHLFSKEQADLNWENPKLREELFSICEFWANKGIDGLRLDVVNLISKPKDFVDDENGDGRRFYTDGHKIHQYLQELNQRALSKFNLMSVGEMSSTSLENCQKYANLEGSELSMTFNFHHLKVDYPKGEKWVFAKPDFVELKKIFSHWQQGMSGKAWNAIFWCNHDQPRIVSRFGDEGEFREISAKMLAMALHGLQGTPYIYQGEELGMTNPNFSSIEQYKDVESLNAYEELKAKGLEEEEIFKILAQKSRDNSRTPMQWDNSKNAGFSKAEKTWIEVAKNYPEINAEAALKNKNSVFYTYQELIKLRQELPVFSEGRYKDLLPNSKELWIYQRRDKENVLTVILNLTAQEQDLDFIPMGEIIMNNYPSLKSKLKPYQAVYFYS